MQQKLVSLTRINAVTFNGMLYVIITRCPQSGRLSCFVIISIITRNFDAKIFTAVNIADSLHILCSFRSRPLTFLILFSFLPARRYASAGLCDIDVSVCLSVRTSVRHTPVLCLAERKQDREMYTVC